MRVYDRNSDMREKNRLEAVFLYPLNKVNYKMYIS